MLSLLCKMAVEQFDRNNSRVICPFCLSVVTIPYIVIEEQQIKDATDDEIYTRNGNSHSRLRIIDGNVYLQGHDTSYHVHRCRDYHHCAVNTDKHKLTLLTQSRSTPTFLLIPLRHSMLVVIPLSTNLLLSVCNPLNYLKWSLHRSWNYRVLGLVFNAVKLQSLMAWCNTIGGAHSSLGDSYSDHAEKAGFVSTNQLVLSNQMGDESLQSKSRLFLAFSFLQQRRLSQAKKLIKSEYISLMKAEEKDKKLINMCLSAWNRYKALMPSTTKSDY